MFRINLTFERPEPEVAHEAGKLHEESIAETLVDSTAEVYTPQGHLLAKYLHNEFSEEVHWRTYEALKGAATTTGSRGYATGAKIDGSFLPFRKRKDGTTSRTRENPVKIKSGIVGFFERQAARIPYCRLTSWTMDNRDKFMAALPFLRYASQRFQELVPDRYASQQLFVENTRREWVIPGTVFTTITVNSNWQTAQHQDEGDCRQGFGVMACLGHDFEGCYLAFPKYRVAFAMRPRDLILADVHQWHCNTPLRLLKPTGERLSLVMYYRENMEKCGSPAEELKFAKNRETGERMWEHETPLFDQD